MVTLLLTFCVQEVLNFEWLGKQRNREGGGGGISTRPSRRDGLLWGTCSQVDCVAVQQQMLELGSPSVPIPVALFLIICCEHDET